MELRQLGTLPFGEVEVELPLVEEIEVGVDFNFCTLNLEGKVLWQDPYFLTRSRLKWLARDFNVRLAYSLSLLSSLSQSVNYKGFSLMQKRGCRKYSDFSAEI